MTHPESLPQDGSTPAAQDAAPHTPSPELAALAREAAQLDGQPAAQAAQAQNAVTLSLASQNVGELRATLVMVRDAVLPLVAVAMSERKSVMLSAIWSDETLAGIAKSGADVLALHGVALSRLTAGFGPYLGLALALGPAAVGTVAVLRSPDPQPAEVVSG